MQSNSSSKMILFSMCSKKYNKKSFQTVLAGTVLAVLLLTLSSTSSTLGEGVILTDAARLVRRKRGRWEEGKTD